MTYIFASRDKAMTAINTFLIVIEVLLLFRTVLWLV